MPNASGYTALARGTLKKDIIHLLIQHGFIWHGMAACAGKPLPSKSPYAGGENQTSANKLQVNQKMLECDKMPLHLFNLCVAGVQIQGPIHATIELYLYS